MGYKKEAVWGRGSSLDLVVRFGFKLLCDPGHCSSELNFYSSSNNDNIYFIKPPYPQVIFSMDFLCK